MYTFGATSRKNLENVHKDLVKVLELALKWSPLDFGVSEGHRTIERQQQLFREGKSQIDGVTRKGKHNYSPSLAVDIYIYHSDLETRRKLAFDKCSLSLVAGVIMAAAKHLEESGEISNKIRWGGNWDGDGVIIYDQSFLDMPHFELKSY